MGPLFGREIDTGSVWNERQSQALAVELSRQAFGPAGDSSGRSGPVAMPSSSHREGALPRLAIEVDGTSVTLKAGCLAIRASQMLAFCNSSPWNIWTAVTDHGVNELRQALPKLEIRR